MKRYNCTLSDKRGAFGLCMEEHKDGAFVTFSEVGPLNQRINQLLEERNSSGLAISNAILVGVVPDKHPLRSRLELLANHRKMLIEKSELCDDLLDLIERMVNCMGLAGEEPEKDSYNPIKAWMYDAISTMAGQRPKQSVAVTETIRTAPERIWLQVGDQASDGDYQFPEHHDEVSWCADSVVACEVPYVRADLADKVPEQHKTNWPDKCPITRRDFFMEIDGVPTYGGPYDSYTIPEMLGTPEQPWHERELFVRRFDHDEGRWVDDGVISQRVIHDGVLDELLDLKEQQADQSGVAPQGGEQLNKNPAATAGQPAPTLNKQPSLTGQVLAGMGAATLLAGLDKESASDVVQLMLEAAEAKGGEPCDSASPSSSPD
ncbi:hypothetical protein [Aeromonas caviae]|uniref:hypothetical protein n=1 Tax=Aeromonas caviae TaxID=648 RepID=UPI002B488F7D|nr:hypothetical protein [Aeromonas caviae]